MSEENKPKAEEVKSPVVQSEDKDPHKDEKDVAPEEDQKKKEENVLEDLSKCIHEDEKDEESDEPVEEKQEDESNAEEEVQTEPEEKKDDVNLYEKFVNFELDTKVGFFAALILALAVLFNIQWINYTWWIVLILAGIGLRNTYKQRLELEDEKPFEASFANFTFIGLIIVLILRDLVLTSKVSHYVEIFTN